MVRKIEWTKPALNDLKSIVDYYNAYSRKYSKLVFDKIVLNVDLLTTYPLLGNLSTYNQVREKVVQKRFSIIYQYFSDSNLLAI
jgi:plasmid stabilization system protein ParE